MYVTGEVKSFAVVPLTCPVEPTFTVDPTELVNVAISDVTKVPCGTVNAIFVPLIVPTTAGVKPSKLNEVRSFSLLAVTVTVTV
ncbi:hypothetical protein D3C73_794430 [compost metagenome]